MNYGYITVASAIPSVRVADADYNIKQIESLIAQAEGKGAEIIVFPELSVTGYSCQDLFAQQTLLDQTEMKILQLLSPAQSKLPAKELLNLKRSKLWNFMLKI